MRTDIVLAKKCLSMIKHRGPDGEGIYNDSEHGVLLGHCRLAVIDLSQNGKQPMTCCSGRYVITYNGELYNYIEIRKELEKLGYVFQSDSDTEVIPAAYDAWGEDCLNRFNGMWAFIIHDKSDGSFFIARDRFGVKPLFYMSSSTGYIFASEMKAIMPHLDNPQIDYEVARGDYMKYSGTECSLIKQIKRLPAGCLLKISKDNSTIKKQWWSTLDNIPNISKKYVDNVDILRDLILDACRIRMRSDVTLGTALSGGLDSSATICSMNKIVKESEDQTINSDIQHAFVASFPGTSLDETYYAKCVADSIGVNATYVDIETTVNPDTLEKMLFHFEEIYNTTPVPMMRLYRTVKENGVTVTLDGHGADELFGGYAGDFRMAFPDAGLNVRKIRDIFNAIYDAYPHDGGSLDAGGNKYDMELYLRAWKSWAWKKTHPDNGIDMSVERSKRIWKRLSSFNRTLYVDTHKTILPTLLRNYDNYSMASGVEIRMPFMDHRIVTMAFALRTDEKLRDGYSKAIIREAMKGIVPDEILYRKTKIGFNTPIAEWMRGPMKAYFLDIINSADYKNTDIVDANMVKRKVESVCASDDEIKFGAALDAYTSLAPYLWKKCFYNQFAHV